jgi:hypothetical protein
MIKLSTVFRYLTGQAFTLYIDSGGGSSGPSQTTNVTTNIPEYARPYVETMLGSAQNELFNYTTDAEGNKTPTSLKGYQAFGGSYDQNPTIKDPTTGEDVPNPNYGKQTGYDANKYFAGFQPLQQQAFGAAGDLGVNQQTMNAGTMAGDIAQRALGTSYDPMQATSQQFGTMQANQYMSPYLESALNPQIAAAERTSQMEGQKQQADAVGRGAYGGSRDALMRMERERGLNAQIEGIRSKGYQDAFTNAQGQFNADQARAQQAQTANIGQQQFGANLGLQGLQAANTAANTLGTAGQQAYAQQTGAINLQNQLGSQQQQAEQAKIDQQIKDYANQQQWSMQQLGNMSNLLRGLPMQSTTTAAYQATPSAASQIAGLGTTAVAGAKLAGMAKGGKVRSGIDHLGMYNAMKK